MVVNSEKIENKEIYWFIKMVLIDKDWMVKIDQTIYINNKHHIKSIPYQVVKYDPIRRRVLEN